jgi:hypothetical protein
MRQNANNPTMDDMKQVGKSLYSFMDKIGGKNDFID